MKDHRSRSLLRPLLATLTVGACGDDSTVDANESATTHAASAGATTTGGSSGVASTTTGTT